jgi:signal transduction histidine kinase
MGNLLEKPQPAGKIKKIARLLYWACIEVRADSEDERRKAFVLNVMLISSILVLSMLGALAIHNAIDLGRAYEGIKISVLLGIYAGFLLSYILLRLGYQRVSAYLLAAMIFIGNAYITFHWGIDVPDMLLSYAFLVVVVGIVINSAAAFISTFIIGSFLSVVGWLQLSGKIPVESYWRAEMFNFRDGLEFSLYFLLIAAVSWLSNREIGASLNRAINSEQALKEERDQLEVTVERRTRELHEAQAERISQMYRFSEFGRLASGFFHDLSNPLMTLELYLDEIKKDAGGKAVQTTHENIQSAIDVAQHIEVFTRSMQNQLRDSDTLEEFSIIEEIKQVISLSRHKLMSNLVHISCEGDIGLKAFGNPLKFHQVILNLISNAIDAYGPLAAELRGDSDNSPRTIEISAHSQGSQAIINVRDHAAGISQEIIAKMFEPFFTTKTDVKNAGLGLSITRTIVEKHFKGTINVDNILPHGAEFRIAMPVYIEQ